MTLATCYISNKTDVISLNFTELHENKDIISPKMFSICNHKQLSIQRKITFEIFEAIKMFDSQNVHSHNSNVANVTNERSAGRNFNILNNSLVRIILMNTFFSFDSMFSTMSLLSLIQVHAGIPKSLCGKV